MQKKKTSLEKAFPKLRMPAPSKAEQMQANALKKLMAEREKYAKSHNNRWPSDEELMKARGGR